MAKAKSGIRQYADITYITKDRFAFSKTKGNFLQVSVDGAAPVMCSAHRMFPLTYEDRYISIRDMEKNELGIIEDLSSLEDSQADLVRQELKRRYFVPAITKVKSVKEEFSYTYWDTETNAGDRSFTIFDMNNSLIPLGGKHVMLIDVDGNRYEIPDITKIGDKALRFLDIWL